MSLYKFPVLCFSLCTGSAFIFGACGLFEKSIPPQKVKTSTTSTVTTTTTVAITPNVTTVTPPKSQLTKHEYIIPSVEQGVNLFVTHVSTSTSAQRAALFLHGAGSPASAAWDLPGENSVLRALAKEGSEAFTVDFRGFGGSTKVQSFQEAAEDNPPAVRAHEVIADVHAAIQFIQQKTGVTKVDLIGWSWGCLVAGLYTTLNAENIHHLVLYAPVYDRKWPKRHITTSAWRSEEANLHYKYFNPKIEKREVLEAYVAALYRFTKTSTRPLPDRTVKLPNGPYRDLYGPEAPIWSPQKVTVATLVIRGGKDYASLHKHAHKLYQDLESAPYKQYLEVSNMGHFAFRTFNSKTLSRAIVNFLKEP